MTSRILSVFAILCLLAACSANVTREASPLEAGTIPEPPRKTGHLAIFGHMLEAPKAQFGIGGGAMFYNEGPQIGLFLGYTYLASGPHLRDSLFNRYRRDRGDVGLLEVGFMWVPLQMWSAYVGLSYGDASIAVKEPDELPDGSIEMIFGAMFGVNLHLYDLITVTAGTRYHHRFMNLLNSDHDPHPSRFPDVWSYELKLGVIVARW